MRKLKITFKKGNYEIVDRTKDLFFYVFGFQIVKIEVL